MSSRIEWLKWRKNGIGSSDAPVIMGVSPHKTILKLYDEKIDSEVNEDQSNNYIKNRGNEIEPKLRSYLECMLNEELKATRVQDSQFSFLRASLDGRNVSGKVIAEFKLVGKEFWTDRVPDKYYPQVMHELMVSGAEICYYVPYLYDAENPNVFDPTRVKVITVRPDKDYFGVLLAEEIKFWDCVVSKRPPMPQDRDYKRLSGAAIYANKWKKLKAQIDKLTPEMEEARTALLQLAELDGHPRLHCSGIKIMKASRQGSVEYKKIPELQNVDLDKYRKKGSVYWTLEIMEEKELQ